MSVEVSVAVWCDWPGCGKGVRGKAGVDEQGVREEAAHLGWDHIADRDYCHKHADGARANAEEATGGA